MLRIRMLTHTWQPRWPEGRPVSVKAAPTRALAPLRSAAALWPTLALLCGSVQAQEPKAAAITPPLIDAEPDNPYAAAGAPEPAVQRLLSQQRDALGRRCELHNVWSRGALRLIACGPAGMWVLRSEADHASLLDIQDLGGDVSDFFSANGRLWVVVNSSHARELALDDAAADTGGPTGSQQPADHEPQRDQRPTAATPAAGVASSVSGTSALGKLIAREDDSVLIATAGAAPMLDSHVAFLGPSPNSPSEQQRYAVGRVVGADAERVRVEIGINEEVPDDASAHLTSAPLTRASFAPPRAAGVWELELLARPFLVLEDLGLGAMVDARVGYRWRQPFHVQAGLVPFAVGTARAGVTTAIGAYISGAYDTRLFEVGLGMGGQTVNDPDFALDPGSGLLVAQQLRLGARDGAHLAFLTYVTLFHSNFQFSSLRVEGQIPLGARTWLRLAGGGGSMGIGFGEVGLRVLTAGNGGPGSFFLTTLIGWTELFRDCNDAPSNGLSSCTAIDYNGPMLGAGGELRL